MKSKLVLLMLALLTVAVALVFVSPAYSYLQQATNVNGTVEANFWPTLPVQWNINPSTTGTTIVGGTDVTTVISNSFKSWTQVPNTSIAALQGANSSVSSEDTPHPGVNLICFVCTGSQINFSNTDGTLAITVTTSSGAQILSGDILFNPSPGTSGSPICFTTDGTLCANSSAMAEDLQTVATHEIGHFFGLDHSGVARAVMFPFAPTLLTTLSWDDAAAIAATYPPSAASVPAGAISGTVTLAGGTGVFGAHVFANSTTNANPLSAFPSIRKSPIGALTDTSGKYTIAGVPADTYLVIAEPLDGPETNINVSWAQAFSQSSVQTNFTTRWH
jgi:hypothetical protein